jgi:uncharacterized protein YaiI (UPF0178 family)
VLWLLRTKNFRQQLNEQQVMKRRLMRALREIIRITDSNEPYQKEDNESLSKSQLSWNSLNKLSSSN